jgi:hypothetical protein
MYTIIPYVHASTIDLGDKRVSGPNDSRKFLEPLVAIAVSVCISDAARTHTVDEYGRVCIYKITKVLRAKEVGVRSGIELED